MIISLIVTSFCMKNLYNLVVRIDPKVKYEVDTKLMNYATQNYLTLSTVSTPVPRYRLWEIIITIMIMRVCFTFVAHHKHNDKRYKGSDISF